MDLLFFSLLFATHLTHLVCKKTIDVFGVIKFAAKPAPRDIPDGSWLTVTLEDASQQDTRSVVLGKFKQEIKGFRVEKPLKYHIESAHLPNHFATSFLAPSVGALWKPTMS